MINQDYKQMSHHEKAIFRDMEAVHSYMENINDQEEFERLYVELNDQYETDGPGQVPHKNMFSLDDR